MHYILVFGQFMWNIFFEEHWSFLLNVQPHLFFHDYKMCNSCHNCVFYSSLGVFTLILMLLGLVRLITVQQESVTLVQNNLTRLLLEQKIQSESALSKSVVISASMMECGSGNDATLPHVGHWVIGNHVNNTWGDQLRETARNQGITLMS